MMTFVRNFVVIFPNFFAMVADSYGFGNSFATNTNDTFECPELHAAVNNSQDWISRGGKKLALQFNLPILLAVKI